MQKLGSGEIYAQEGHTCEVQVESDLSSMARTRYFWYVSLILVEYSFVEAGGIGVASS